MTNRLQELRLARNETQQQMADIMGISNSSIYCRKELGGIKVSIEEAHAAAKHFGVSIEDIFFADEAKIDATSKA